MYDNFLAFLSNPAFLQTCLKWGPIHESQEMKNSYKLIGRCESGRSEDKDWGENKMEWKAILKYLTTTTYEKYKILGS
jgi:hypothetical protein